MQNLTLNVRFSKTELLTVSAFRCCSGTEPERSMLMSCVINVQRRIQSWVVVVAEWPETVFSTDLAILPASCKLKLLDVGGIWHHETEIIL